VEWPALTDWRSQHCDVLMVMLDIAVVVLPRKALA
jgi:hypothetical protein